MNFCVFFQKIILPATTVDLVAFLELMSLTCGYDHLKSVLSSIKFIHLSLDLTFPEESFQLKNTLQSIKRKKSNTPHQVLPITPAILHDMFRHIDTNKKSDLALWCAFLVSFFCLFRKASVVPKQSSDGEQSLTLTRRHLLLNRDLKTVLVYVSHSKVIQFGQRELVIPLLGNDDPALDPYRHVSRLLDSIPCNPDQPAFSYSKTQFITYSSFTKRLRELLNKSGYNPELYAGHSFRRGGASYLYKCGGTALQVQSSGDWLSSCYT